MTLGMSIKYLRLCIYVNYIMNIIRTNLYFHQDKSSKLLVKFSIGFLIYSSCFSTVSFNFFKTSNVELTLFGLSNTNVQVFFSLLN